MTDSTLTPKANTFLKQVASHLKENNLEITEANIETAMKSVIKSNKQLADHFRRCPESTLKLATEIYHEVREDYKSSEVI